MPAHVADASFRTFSRRRHPPRNILSASIGHSRSNPSAAGAVRWALASNPDRAACPVVTSLFCLLPLMRAIAQVASQARIDPTGLRPASKRPGVFGMIASVDAADSAVACAAAGERDARLLDASAQADVEALESTRNCRGSATMAAARPSRGHGGRARSVGGAGGPMASGGGAVGRDAVRLRAAAATRPRCARTVYRDYSYVTVT